MKTEFENDLISFVIPAHQDHWVLLDCINSVKMQKMAEYRTEIIIVDNSPSGLKLNDPALKIIRCPPVSAAKARNSGIENAKGRWLSFVDSDTILTDGWLETLLSGMIQMNATAGQGMILTKGKKEDSIFGQFRQLQNQHGQNGLLASTWLLPALNTSACILDRTFYPKLQFDIDLKYAEDVELSWRILTHFPSRWYFSEKTSATCFEPSESLIRCWKRNFGIAKSMLTICSRYPDLVMNEFFQTQNWVKLEAKNCLKQLSLSRLARLISSLSFYAGLISGTKDLIKHKKNTGYSFIVYDDKIRQIDLDDFSSKVRPW